MAAESSHGKFYTVPFRWVGAKRKAFCSRADDRSMEKIVKNRVSVGRVGEICRFEIVVGKGVERAEEFIGRE